MFRHAGNGIRLQRPARTVFFQNEIRARNPFARQRAVGTNRKLLHHPRRFIRQRRGTQVLRTTGSIFRLEIVEIAFRNDFDYCNASTSASPMTATVNSLPLYSAQQEPLNRCRTPFSIASPIAAAPSTMNTPSALPSVPGFTTQCVPSFSTIESTS